MRDLIHRNNSETHLGRHRKAIHITIYMTYDFEMVFEPSARALHGARQWVQKKRESSVFRQVQYTCSLQWNPRLTNVPERPPQIQMQVVKRSLRNFKPKKNVFEKCEDEITIYAVSA